MGCTGKITRLESICGMPRTARGASCGGETLCVARSERARVQRHPGTLFPGWAPDPRMPVSWWFRLAPATLEFWVRFPNERNQGKQAHPVLKYRVPHGSHPHRPRLVVSRSTCAPLSSSPHSNSFVIGTAVTNTHTSSESILLRVRWAD